jgi:4-hydroxy-3-polyprenylbenzoate decarboxylase
VHTLAGIANGYGEHLVHRAADVVLKERRRLVLVVRETPLSEVHLENMLKLARMGVTIVPPVPAFYNHPQTIDDIVNHIVARVLDQFDLPAPFAKRWDGHLHTATKIATVAPSSGSAAKSGT